LAFEIEASGKPRLSGEHSGIKFNCSHSHGLTLIAITRGSAIGVDMEARQAADEHHEVASAFFSPDELGELMAVPSERMSEAFLASWTRKEAYVKADGSGLRMPLDSFRLPVLSGGGQCQFVLNDRRWTLFSLLPESGYYAAVVAEGAKHAIRQFSFHVVPEKVRSRQQVSYRDGHGTHE